MIKYYKYFKNMLTMMKPFIGKDIYVIAIFICFFTGKSNYKYYFFECEIVWFQLRIIFTTILPKFWHRLPFLSKLMIRSISFQMTATICSFTAQETKFDLKNNFPSRFWNRDWQKCTSSSSSDHFVVNKESAKIVKMSIQMKFVFSKNLKKWVSMQSALCKLRVNPLSLWSNERKGLFYIQLILILFHSVFLSYTP